MGWTAPVTFTTSLALSVSRLNEQLRDNMLYLKALMDLLVPSVGAGAVVAGKCTASEGGNSVVHQTTLTLTLTGANDLDLADGADHGTGVLIYNFPEGRINVLGVVMNGVVVCNDAFNADPNDTFNVACGTVTAADDGTLTSSEVALIPSTTIDTTGNTVLTNTWHAAKTTASHYDGTAGAIGVYVNAAVLDTSTTKALTIAITGTLTITWINLGDY